jgi:hypothetical protein
MGVSLQTLRELLKRRERNSIGRGGSFTPCDLGSTPGALTNVASVVKWPITPNSYFVNCQFDPDRTHWGFDGRQVVSESADECSIHSAPTKAPIGAQFIENLNGPGGHFGAGSPSVGTTREGLACLGARSALCRDSLAVQGSGLLVRRRKSSLVQIQLPTPCRFSQGLKLPRKQFGQERYL